MTATAPGKIMLTGEYAVLEGHVAVVAAINRRAAASLAESEQVQTPLLQNVAAVATERSQHLGSRARRVVVNTSDFSRGDQKLGIGSSAAAAVAASALTLATGSSGEVLALAFEAHARTQEQRGVRGSGADIAAAVHGGVIAVRKTEVQPLEVRSLSLPNELELFGVWTGTPADTVDLVAAVRSARGANKTGFDGAIAEIAAASRELCDALSSGSAQACVTALGHASSGISELARATGVPLITETHRQIRALAASRGGAAKPTGAGGGDVCLVAFTGAEAASSFRGDLALVAQGSRMIDLDLRVDNLGATFEGS